MTKPDGINKANNDYKAIVILGAFVLACIVMFQVYNVYRASEESSTPTVEKVERKTYTVDWIAKTMIYTRDERTSICFAGPAINHSNTSFTMVPCTEEVLQIIRDRGEK